MNYRAMSKLSSLFHFRNQLSHRKSSAKDVREALSLHVFMSRAGISTARETSSAGGKFAGRITAPYSVYKGKAALSAAPILPTFIKLDSGGLKVDRRGTIMLTFWPAIGDRKYDWEKRQMFALSATEVGSLISLSSKDSCEFFHDPSMLSSNAGQVRKSLSVKPHDSGYFISLSVVNNILKTNDRFTVPVTTAEFAVMRTAFNFALPHLMGWDRYTNQLPKSMQENPSKPSYMFTDKEHRGPFAFSEEVENLSIGLESASNAVSAQMVEANDNDLLLSTSEKEESRGPSSNGSAYSAPSYDGSSNHPLPAHSPQTSLAIDDLLGLGLPVGPNPAPPLPHLKLNARAVLDSRTFQQKWRQLPISVSQEYSINPQGVAALTTPQSLPRHMHGHSIQCIASVGHAPNFKFLFFAQKAEESSTFLVECIISSSSCKALLKIKADDQSMSQAFSDLFQSALSKLGMP